MAFRASRVERWALPHEPYARTLISMSASLIYLVDNTLDGQGASPRELQAAFKHMHERLEIVTEAYAAVSLERVNSLRPSHIVLSGQSHPWTSYPPGSLDGVVDVIKKATQPILGVCGGHQQIAEAYGAAVGLMARLEPGDGYQGAKRERGFFPVETIADLNGASLFKELPQTFTVWHSHFDEVKELPEDFKRTAFNETCAIQAMQHTSRPVFGVQFHPELFNDEHPEGRQILENFLQF